ncbi:anther-specific protein LAT52-like [Rhododendron vialii]|uniref:anther-specific protein LAT52-like n=1 Tax=Rhododendron vialii TaxID=182163 RepID=UPI00265F9FD8|nr:anther-specific protein LAT52-like [Rhododendron vialii]
MAKAVALIAFALGVLAIAGNVQAGFDNSGKFVKENKFYVDSTNKFSVEGKVLCATCNVNSGTDFQPLGKVEVEIKCRSRKNGTVTLIQPALADDGGYYKTYVEDGHHDDLCMVRAVASPDPRCNVKAPGFRSARITLGNYSYKYLYDKDSTKSKDSTLYVEKLMVFLNNEALPNCRRVRGKRGNLIPKGVLDYAGLSGKIK